MGWALASDAMPRSPWRAWESAAAQACPCNGPAAARNAADPVAWRPKTPAARRDADKILHHGPRARAACPALCTQPLHIHAASRAIDGLSRAPWARAPHTADMTRPPPLGRPPQLPYDRAASHSGNPGSGERSRRQKRTPPRRPSPPGTTPIAAPWRASQKARRGTCLRANRGWGWSKRVAPTSDRRARDHCSRTRAEPREGQDWLGASRFASCARTGAGTTRPDSPSRRLGRGTLGRRRATSLSRPHTAHGKHKGSVIVLLDARRSAHCGASHAGVSQKFSHAAEWSHRLEQPFHVANGGRQGSGWRAGRSPARVRLRQAYMSSTAILFPFQPQVIGYALPRVDGHSGNGCIAITRICRASDAPKIHA